ncbi:hypothetical protein [Endozoicomonas atrinae]|uniref:hypothetical protein n=1 Tax=Endozoicomonas atrinae TaxID=1333660 RepID=UPI003B004D1E
MILLLNQGNHRSNLFLFMNGFETSDHLIDGSWQEVFNSGSKALVIGLETLSGRRLSQHNASIFEDFFQLFEDFLIFADGSRL